VESMSLKTTRAQIIEAADLLFYQQGYEHTSFADIADVVHISRGNFYYHFKSKDEILAAVIDLRLINTKRLLERWQKEGKEPKERIHCFVQRLINNRKKIKSYGCPVGSLCSELTKLDHASQTEANKIFTLFRLWLRKQFIQLGCNSNADALAMHLLARSQGVATLANAFHDEKFIKQEVKLMSDWLNSLSVSAAK